MKPKPLTVVITSFKRATYLRRAIQSVFSAGISRVAVASMEPTPEVQAVAREFSGNPGFSFSSIEADLGCNELWIQAAYRADTSRVLLLHDDDCLDPSFGEVYDSQISPFLDQGGFVTWRARVRQDDGQERSADYWTGPTRKLSPLDFHRYLLGTGKLSLSPIVTVFDRNTLIASLKECREKLVHPDCLLHPGMLLGTEIIAHLRNSQNKTAWLYLDKVLAYYGSHAGSGTVKAEQSNDLSELIRGYDYSRNYFIREGRKLPAYEPRILFVYNEYATESSDTKRRNAYAKKTWDFHFNQGEMLEFPVADAQLTRSSASLGDTHPVPYVRDLVNYGMERARPEDIVVIANRDICLTTAAVERLVEGIRKGRGYCAAVRRNFPHPNPNTLYRSARGCKPDGGFDLFAFSPAWWKAQQAKFPDMLLGREAWDTCWRMLAEELCPRGCAYVDDMTYHEPHQGQWEKERLTGAGQIYNRKVCLTFSLAHKYNVLARGLIAALS